MNFSLACMFSIDKRQVLYDLVRVGLVKQTNVNVTDLVWELVVAVDEVDFRRRARSQLRTGHGHPLQLPRVRKDLELPRQLRDEP